MSVHFNNFLVQAAEWLIATSRLCLNTTQLIELYLADQSTQPPVEPAPDPDPTPTPEPEPPLEPEPQLSYFEKTYRPATDTRIIHVSSSTGSDTNDGAKSTPVKTIAKGLSLLRDGKPDWLLFKRGDTWVGETFGNLSLSGLGENDPMVFGSYGNKSSPRPLFDTQDKIGINVFDRSSQPSRNCDYLAFVGLHFVASTRIPSSPNFNSNSNPTGFRWLRGTEGLTIDDCKFEYYHTNIIIQSYQGSVIKNVRILNSQLFNAYAHNPNVGHSQGGYFSGVNGLTIADCFVDYNGVNHAAPESEATIYNHNLYIQKNCSGVSVTHNIITRASSHGCQIRPGGLVMDNFFWENPINLLVGYDDPSIHAIVEGNVIAGGTNISSSLPRCWGIEFKGQNPPGVSIVDNLVVNAIATSPNSRSIENRSNVYYEGNIAHNWPPTGRFDNSNANYVNPDVSINNVDLYLKMREHSMDNPKLDVYEYITKYRNAFTEV